MSLNNLITISIMHTVLLKDNNDVLIFGVNKYGQLGLGHNHDQNKPVTLMRGIPIRKIACKS